MTQVTAYTETLAAALRQTRFRGPSVSCGGRQPGHRRRQGLGLDQKGDPSAGGNRPSGYCQGCCFSGQTRPLPQGEGRYAAGAVSGNRHRSAGRYPANAIQTSRWLSGKPTPISLMTEQGSTTFSHLNTKTSLKSMAALPCPNGAAARLARRRSKKI